MRNWMFLAVVIGCLIASQEVVQAQSPYYGSPYGAPGYGVPGYSVPSYGSPYYGSPYPQVYPAMPMPTAMPTVMMPGQYGPPAAGWGQGVTVNLQPGNYPPSNNWGYPSSYGSPGYQGGYPQHRHHPHHEHQHQPPQQNHPWHLGHYLLGT